MVEGTDGTAEILRRLAQRDGAPASTILEPPERHGLGAAFRLGFDAVPDSAGIVVTMDADHQPEELKRLLDAFETENADIVIGSRQVPGVEIRSMAAWRDGRAMRSIGCCAACPARLCRTSVPVIAHIAPPRSGNSD